MSAASGHCLCGAVRFTVESVDPHYWACHCSMCLRWSAGPFLSVSTTGVSFEGKEYMTVFGSSEWADRGFCNKCGTILFYRLKEKDEYEMNTGTFDDSSSFKMIGEIFIDQKPDGYDFAGDHPRLTEAEALAKFSLGGD